MKPASFGELGINSVHQPVTPAEQPPALATWPLEDMFVFLGGEGRRFFLFFLSFFKKNWFTVFFPYFYFFFLKLLLFFWRGTFP